MIRNMKNIRKIIMAALVAFSVVIACGCTKPDDPNNGGGGGNSGGGGGGGLNVHAYVDLGLPSGTLWATCNVGADTPEGYGDYFAWGETQSGSGWCMPTYNQWRELKVSTNTSWTTQNGVNGRLFTASNGNSLFLPAAGYRGGTTNSTMLTARAAIGRVHSPLRAPTCGSSNSVRTTAAWTNATWATVVLSG